MRLSLKLFLPALITASLLAAYLLWSWAPRFLSHTETEYEASLARQLDGLAVGLAPLLREQRLEEIQGSLDTLLWESPDWLGLRLTDERGKLLYPWVPPSNAALGSILNPGLNPGGADQVGNTHTLSRTLGPHDDPLGRLAAVVDFTPARAYLEANRNELLTVLLAGLLVFLLLSGIVIEVWVRRPLRLLAHASTRFAQGDAHALLPAERGGEIGELVRGVSLMRDAMRQHETALHNEVNQRRRTEQALRESEERYALAVRGANDGLWEWNLKTQEIYYSPRWKTMLGYAEDEIGNRFEEWQQRVHPDDLPQVLADLKAHLDGHTPRYESEHRLLHKDGSYRWVLTRGAAIRHASGKPYRMVGLHTDITERKGMEEILWRIAEATSAMTGDEFFQSLVRHFASLLGVRYAFVTECVDFPTTRVRTLAFWTGESFAQNVEYPLAGTPCHDVIADGKVCLYSQGVPTLFPNDKGMAEMGVESFLGIPIVGSSAQVIGHLAFCDDKPMGDELLVQSIFKIFTARAAAELERRHAEQAVEQAQLRLAVAQKEREIAKRIHQALLPQTPQELKGAVVTGRCIPAAEMGGDYFDLFLGPDGTVDLVIADVSGHGIGAAVIMAETRSALRAESYSLASPAAVLHHLNRLLYDDLTRAEFFITMFYAKYDAVTRWLTYASAGRNPPLLLRQGTPEFERLDADGLVLGVRQDIEFEERQVVLDPGDMLIFYTDGIIESQGGDGTLFGLDRLCGVLAARRAEPPDAIIDAVVCEARGFCQAESFADDVAMLVLKLLDDTRETARPALQHAAPVPLPASACAIGAAAWALLSSTLRLVGA
jgi:PAS domain S-box-containing protein